MSEGQVLHINRLAQERHVLNRWLNIGNGATDVCRPTAKKNNVCN